MPYNPDIHDRKSIRLKGYDYSQAGLYFITVCAHDKKCLFGKIAADEMIMNEFGIISFQQWLKLPQRFENMELDVFQIMPNHMRGIIILNPPGAGARAGASAAPIGDIVGAYKSLVTRDCLEIFKQKTPNEMMGKLWQRNYNEHIIRNEQSYHQIADYIINNAENSKDDAFHDGQIHCK